MRQIQGFKSKFDVAFLCIYDVIRLHQVSGSENYDDAMTKQVPGVSWANFVGRHKPSVPKESNSNTLFLGIPHRSAASLPQNWSQTLACKGLLPYHQLITEKNAETCEGKVKFQWPQISLQCF